MTPKEGIKGAVSISIAQGSQGAAASIDRTLATDAAPTVHAAGNVGVISRVLDLGIRSDAASTVNSNSDTSNANSPTATKAISAALAYDIAQHSSTALVGRSVTINAANVGVSTTSSVPATIPWLDFSNIADLPDRIGNEATNIAGTFAPGLQPSTSGRSLREVYDDDVDTARQLSAVGDVTQKLNGNLGLVNQVLTSYSDAQSAAKDKSLSATVNYLKITNDTAAWIASDATVTTTGTAGWTAALATTMPDPASPTYVVPASGAGSSPQSIAFLSGVDVNATSRLGAIDFSGNLGFFSLTGTQEGAHPGANPLRSE